MRPPPSPFRPSWAAWRFTKIPALDLTAHFDPGEDLRTEISVKFRRDALTAELAAAGFTLRRWWTDPHGEYALALSELV